MKKKMKRTMFFLMIMAAACTMTSCLTSGLDELEAFDEADITDVYFEHRYVMDGNGSIEVVNFQRLTVLSKEVDSEQGTITVLLDIPPANATFSRSERSKVTLNNLAAYCYLSTAASITPVDGAPRLGTLGDYASPVKYRVTAADGKTSKVWTIIARFPEVVLVPQVASWLFDDAGNLGKASLGQDLILNGDGFTSVPGPSAGNGAVRVAQGSYFKALHGMAANGGGERVNNYTLMVDFKVSELGRYYCFFQTTLENNDDGDYFLRPAGNLGIGGTGYSEHVVSAGEWHRLVISAGMGNAYLYYLDGELIHTGNIESASIDSRFSWLPEGVLLFADEDGEDAEIDIAEVAVWNGAMNTNQVESLGPVQ
jgi:hypothetical protein